MMVQLECTYCGKIWKAYAHTKAAIEAMNCTRCGDTSLKITNLEDSKIDYYKGCPPFPEKHKSYNDMSPEEVDRAVVEMQEYFDRSGL